MSKFSMTEKEFDERATRANQLPETIQMLRQILVDRKSVSQVSEAHKVARQHVYQAIHRFCRTEQEREPRLSIEDFERAVAGRKNPLYVEAARKNMVEGFTMRHVCEQYGVDRARLQSFKRHVLAAAASPKALSAARLRRDPEWPKVSRQALDQLRESPFVWRLSEQGFARAEQVLVEGKGLSEVAALKTFGTRSQVNSSTRAVLKALAFHARHAGIPKSAAYQARLAELMTKPRLDITMLEREAASEYLLHGTPLKELAKRHGLTKEKTQSAIYALASQMDRTKGPSVKQENKKQEMAFNTP